MAIAKEMKEAQILALQRRSGARGLDAALQASAPGVAPSMSSTGASLGARQVERPGSRTPGNINSFSSQPGLRARWDAPRSVPQFERPVSGLASGSLLNMWDAKGNIGGSETTTLAQDRESEAATRASAQAGTPAGWQVDGGAYSGLSDAVQMGGLSEELGPQALIAATANRMQDEQLQRMRDSMLDEPLEDDFYGANPNG